MEQAGQEAQQARAGAGESARAGRAGMSWRAVITCGLIVLVGINLRTVILGVPPVLPLVQGDLDLSHTAIGLLTALPVLVMGGLALPAGLLAGRIGGRASVALGLALLAAGAALRAVFPAAVPLFIFTTLLSLGIAVAQTAVPVLARQWFPRQIGLVSALYTDGLIAGEALAAGITAPLMGALIGPHGWAGTFVLWSLPVALTLALWLLLAPAAPATAPRPTPGARVATPAARDKQARASALHLGALLGSGSLIYFGMNGWIASYNQARHVPGLTPAALAILNAAQLPVSLMVTLAAQRLAGRGGPFIVAGTLVTLAIAGWVFGPAELEPLWAAVLGGSSALAFTLGIALPALLAHRAEVARLAGQTLGISYGLAFLGPLLGGALWDLTGVPAMAFLPVAAAALALIVLGARLPRQHLVVDEVERDTGLAAVQRAE